MTTPPAQPTEPDRDRLANWKIALVSAGSALLGALIGGVFSYFVAVHQSDSQAKDNQVNFARQQQVNAYAKMLADVDEAGVVFSSLVTEERTGSPLDTIKSDSDKLDGDLSAVGKDMAQVQIVGSLQTAIDAQGLYSDFLMRLPQPIPESNA